MLDRILASVGIGAAKVDARLSSASVQPGGTLWGAVVIQGGEVAQRIDRLYMRLVTDFIREHDEHVQRVSYTLASWQLERPFTIEPGQTERLPFELAVPSFAPISFGAQKSSLHTGLDISKAIDPSDQDAVSIVPDPITRGVLEAVAALGFKHTHESGRCVYRRAFSGVPFVQEFELKPTGGPFRQELDEIELHVSPGPGGIEVLMQVDRRARGLAGMLNEAMGLDERYVRMRFQSPPSSRELEQAIRRGMGH